MLNYLKGGLSPKEQSELDAWVNRSPANKELFEKLTDESHFQKDVDELFRYKAESWDRISKNVGGLKVVPMRRMRVRWVAAASIIFIMAAAAYLFLQKRHVPQLAKSAPPVKATDILAPVENLATITLDDGTKLYLDSLNNMPLPVKSNVELVKLSDKQVGYKLIGGIEYGDRIEYNTLTNPRGSKVIEMELSDGSHVWLNSGTSLRYPVVFLGRERSVEITGEAYFEVAHDPKKPFHVKRKGMDIAVLGTHFNVNAYEDEDALRVTLLEGSVAISVHHSTVRIKPGEQAVVTENIRVVPHVDIEEVMAWKNGRFEFNNSPVESVMRQISRWYDVDIEYVGKKPDIHFIGSISRTQNVSEVLHMLEQTKAVRFQVRNRKIQVMK